jgi:hypothetical protein
VVERGVEVVHGRLQADEHGDAERDEDRGEDEPETMAMLMMLCHEAGEAIGIE